MKKIFPYVLLFLGLSLGVFSITQGWAGLFFEIAGITMKKAGYEFIQGQIAAAGLLIAAVLFFVKPKLTAIGALIAIIGGVWMIASPPVVEDVAWKTEKVVYALIVGGVLIGLAGLMAPTPNTKTA